MLLVSVLALAACSGLRASTVETVESGSASTVDKTVQAQAEKEPFHVLFEGVGYECRDASGGFHLYDCAETRGPQSTASKQPELYCSGSESVPECSELWYPSELDQYRLVEFDGASLLCEPFDDGCVEYEGGRPPSSIGSPDVWCENEHCTYFDPDQYRLVEFDGGSYLCEQETDRCVEYTGGRPPDFLGPPDIWCDNLKCTYFDPNRYFEIPYDFQTYVCETAFLSAGFDCYQPIDNSLPVSFAPDLYCSGSEFAPKCSELWYPDELDRYQLVDSGDSLYLCQDAISGSFRDYDCGTYEGGDPSLVYMGELKCSDSYGSFECGTEFYPSELEGLEIVTISFRDYVCKDTLQGSECFEYFGGSPASATYGNPDFYCNGSGQCARDTYP